MSEQMGLQQLMDLISKQKEQQTALDKVAATPVTNQPWRPQGDTRNAFAAAMGRGAAPEQSRALNQLYGAILNRNPGQSAIGAATDGFEKGSQLMDSLRTKRKSEDMLAASTPIQGTQQAFDNTVQGMTRGAAIDKNNLTAGKPQQVTANGKVYLLYPDGSMVLAGSSEGSMNRGQEEAFRQQDATALANQADQEKITAGRQASDSIGMVAQSVKDIRDNIDWSTTGGISAVSQINPGSDAAAQEGRYSHLKSILAIDKLQEMRALSADGSSGFGQLTQNEFAALMSSIDTLSSTASTARQKEALDNVEKYYEKAVNSYAEVVGQAQDSVALREAPTAENMRFYDEVYGPGAAARAIRGKAKVTK